MQKRGGEFFGAQGQADDVALICFAAFLCEELLLGQGFDAFGDDGELHASAQGDNCPHDGRIVRVIRQAADE